MLIELVNIGRDASLQYTASGTPVSNFPAAYDIGYGENKKTQWIDCVMFGKKAEALAQHLTKGKQIQIFGKDVRIETWQKNDGSGEGFKLVCTVDDIKFCRGDSQQSAPQSNSHHQNYGNQSSPSARPAPQQRNPNPPQSAPAGGMDSFDDDIPFNHFERFTHC